MLRIICCVGIGYGVVGRGWRRKVVVLWRWVWRVVAVAMRWRWIVTAGHRVWWAWSPLCVALHRGCSFDLESPLDLIAFGVLDSVASVEPQAGLREAFIRAS